MTRRSARTSLRKRRFGPLQREVSIIGQGTWYTRGRRPASAIAALRRGIDLGMNHVDTAEMYGVGATQEVGNAIAGRRDEIFLVSKVLPQNVSRLGTKIACERSLTSRPTGAHNMTKLMSTGKAGERAKAHASAHHR
jgi:diketogulonate reductase-like aldo/keto reductase